MLDNWLIVNKLSLNVRKLTKVFFKHWDLNHTQKIYIFKTKK